MFDLYININYFIQINLKKIKR